MIRHTNNSFVTDLQIFGFNYDSAGTQIIDFTAEVLHINNHTVTHNVNYFGTEDTGGKQIEDKLSSFINNGVSRIVAALIAANDVAFFSEQIDHTAFAFIAPVDSDNRCKHNNSISNRLCNFVPCIRVHFIIPSLSHKCNTYGRFFPKI